jgi:hypothetical protein
MRYDHLGMLPDNAFKPMGKRMTLEGGGGKGKSSSSAPAPQNSSVYQTNIPEYAKPYVQSMLGAAQSEMFNIDSSGNITGTKPYVPYSANPEDYVAGFSPLQQTSFNRAAGLGVPDQFGQATQLGGAAGLGSLGLAGQAAGAGQQFQNMATNPNAVQAYMNPYLKASLDPQIEAIRRQYDINQTQQQGTATQAGAFGGSREALMAAENRRAMNSAMNATIGQGYNTAFQNAQNQMQYGAGLGLQGLQAGLGGLGQAGSIAGTLGNLGTNQLAAQQGVINTQNLLGTQQQQQQQNIINQSIQDYATAQQYPMLQLANMSNLLRGLPMQSTTTQTYQAAPSMLSQVAGLGTGIAGAAQLMKAEGGTVKSYAKGGIASFAPGGDVMSQDNAERIARDLRPQQLEKVQSRTLPDYIRIPLMAEKLEEQKAAQQAQAAAQAQPNQPTIKDMILAQAEQAQGIDAADSGMPSQGFAGGGIVAFAQGGAFEPTPLDTTIAKRFYEESLNPQGKRYTQAEVEAQQAARREERGIKDIYTGQLEELQKEKAGLEGQKDRALGLSLLSASGKMLGNTSPFAFAGIGEGLGDFSTKYGSALDKIEANKIALRKDENAILAAQQGMKEAQMAGDTAAFKTFEDRYTTALTNYDSVQRDNVKLTNAAHLERDKLLEERKTKLAVQASENVGRVDAARAGNIGVVSLPNSLNTMIGDRESQYDKLEKEYLATDAGRAYQSAKANLARGTKAKADVAAYEAGKIELSNRRDQVNKIYGPIIKNQIRQARQYGHEISEQEEKDILSGAVKIEDVINNNAGGAGGLNLNDPKYNKKG